MNTENILRLADILDKQNHPLPLTFDMNTYLDHGTDCGTAGCIAGWAATLANEDLFYAKDLEPLTLSKTARDWLELGILDGHDLFHPEFNDEKEWDEVTAQDAAKVLRHLANTGKVDWNIII